MLLFTILASSNIEIWALPNNGLSLASALIIRLLFLSCRPFFLMCSHTFLTISVLGNGLLPITSASELLGVKGAMKAALGFLVVFLAAVLAAAFLAGLLLAVAFLG